MSTSLWNFSLKYTTTLSLLEISVTEILRKINIFLNFLIFFAYTGNLSLFRNVQCYTQYSHIQLNSLTKKISQNNIERLYPIHKWIWLNFAVEYSMQINFELNKWTIRFECKTSGFCLLNRFKIKRFKIKVHPPAW